MIIYYFNLEDDRGKFKHDDWNKICEAKWKRPEPALAASKDTEAPKDTGAPKKVKGTGKRGRVTRRK